MENKKSSFFSFRTVKGKLLFYFLLVIVLLSMINIYTYTNSRRILMQIDKMFENTVKLAELGKSLEASNTYLEKYLVSKSESDRKMFKKNINILKSKIVKIERTPSKDMVKLQWKNSAYLIDEYILYAEAAVKAKEERKIVTYYSSFNEAERIMGYIKETTESINKTYLENNIRLYIDIEEKLKKLQMINLIIIVLVIAGSIVIVAWSSESVTKPIALLAENAKEISQGKFDIEDIKLNSEDEIEETAAAFNEMKNSIKRYVEEIRRKSDVEIKLAEQEMQNLKMKNLVKNARLETLQAQMNPHFLFNTINACIQIAQIENAEKTADFLYNMGKLFRHNLKNINSFVTIKDEIENVDAYIYLLKIRYEDILCFEKDIDEQYLGERIPLLTLQPLVENSFLHGISGNPNGGTIKLEVKGRDGYIEVSVKDNGVGMDAAQIKKIFNSESSYDLTSEKNGKGNGIGIRNVIQRLRLFYETDALFIESEPGKGTSFTIRVPMNNNKE